jgi:integrative and conjugative element protein (TIGR02256 family)
MDRHRQADDDLPESGGILLGRWIVDSQDVVVDSATPPTPEDRRGRFFFWRALKPAQRIVNAAWSQSAQTQWYLGEWHSHPEDHPTPSSKDREDWLRILREARYEQPALFFAIVGCMTISVWEGVKVTGVTTQLLPMDSAK